MKRFLKASTFLSVVAMFAVLLLKAGVAEAAGAALVEQLNAVAAVSARNIWAVGYSISGNGEQPLIEHWNGKKWSIVPAPGPNPWPNAINALNGVAAVSGRDVWAVGNFTDSNGNLQPLIERWNGRQWSIVAGAPLPAGFDGGVLSGIEGVSAHNIWAVGDSFNIATELTQSLIEHWNGKQWSIVASPNTGSTAFLYGVAEVSAHNIWAVGNPLGSGLPFTEHWDGKQWSIVAPPAPTGPVITLFGIAEVSAHDVWTVGYYIDNRDIDRTLIEHWDGTMWSIIPSPNSGPTADDVLDGVAAISTNNVWAVGSSMNTGSTPGQSLIEHWDGVQWSVVPGTS